MPGLILVVLDGWGINPRQDANAIALADTPTWDELTSAWPMSQLDASGTCAGLREGLMGNSEVGHMNMGAGRIITQAITRIDASIRSGDFFKISAFTHLIAHLRKTGGSLHLMGLLSDGGVHSAEDHYLALIDLAKQHDIASDKLYIHCFMDGRDTPVTSGVEYVNRLQNKIDSVGIGSIGSIMGRSLAMDRDNRWDRTQRAYDAIVHGKGVIKTNPIQSVQEAYARGETDEFITPIIIADSTGHVPGTVGHGDGVIFFNFRADRTRQLTKALTDQRFTHFNRNNGAIPKLSTMTSYHEDFTHLVAFDSEPMDHLLGEVISQAGLRQLRIAETEKYAHVTFFFNGGSDVPYAGEDRKLIPSPKVATYDLKPEMSAHAITNGTIDALRHRKTDVIILNFANTDMVGHTGKIDATIQAVEAVDRELKRLFEVSSELGASLLITADHGNAEQMIDYTTGAMHTYHTTHPVPFILCGRDLKGLSIRDSGTHQDIAPTMLELLSLPRPTIMRGHSLILR